MKNLYRSGIVLILASGLLAFNFFVETANAQTKPSKKPAPTPVRKKSPEKETKKEAKKNGKTDAKKSVKETSKSANSKTTSPSAKQSKNSDKSRSSAAAQKEKSASKTKSSGGSKSKVNDDQKSKKDAASTARKDNKSASRISKTAPRTPSRSDVKPSNEQLIVVATDSRIRREPKQSAPQLSLVKIGKLLPVYEKNGGWHRVEYENGKSGWIADSTTRDYENDDRDEIYQNIADKYAKNKSLDFATAAEVSDFLRTAQALVKKDETKADLGFKRLRILTAAVKAVPSGKGDAFPYKSFLQAHEKEVVYSEPSATWLVRSDLFWELHGKYMQSPVAEEIAWEAAQNTIPGECEGYINCRLYVLRAMEGEYLNFYPNGRYSRKALELVTMNLGVMVAEMNNKTAFTPLADISDRAEFNRFLTELRTIISKVADADKAKPLQQINQLGEGYK